MKAPIFKVFKIRFVFVLLIAFTLGSCTSQKESSKIIIEIIDAESDLDISKMSELCELYNIKLSSIHNWENHWVFYVDSDKEALVTKYIEEKFPLALIKLYESPLYVFDKEKHCGLKAVPRWSNIIMTANLVDNVDMQDEYMEYHRTQFEDWPEVASGFCNANFQQVLVYRSGRQLMLVISIPEDENLDNLNPKTTENNPRVDEWNQIMSKYQEGIEDAPEGSVWIELANIR